MEDNREFRRYSCQSACEIRIDNSVYNGFVVDFSDGLGVIVEKSPLFRKGAVADIRILNSSTEMKGQVAWLKELGKDIRVGFKRVGNLKGNIKDFKLADLLIGIQRGTKTGILEIVSGSIVKRVYIKNGDMIFADSSSEDDRLGELLLKEGRITMDQFNLASQRLLATGEKLGKILVDLSYITPRELFRAARRQVEEIIISIFNIAEGAFVFKEGPLSSSGFITLKISAADIIYRGMKRIKSFMYIKQMCPSSEAVLDVSQDPMDIYQSFSLDYADKQILYSINGRDPLKKILSLYPSQGFETLKTITALLSIGIIKVKRHDDVPSMVSVGDILKEQVNEIPEEFLKRVDTLYAQCESSDYYAFLDVKRGATYEQIQRAYYRISKQFHPDRHFAFPNHDVKSKLIKISVYATEANNILSDPEKRERYDKALLQKEQHKAMREDTGQASPEIAGASKGTPVQRLGDNDMHCVIRDFQEGREQTPQENSETPYELGVAYMEMGLVDDAMQEFRNASRDPSKKINCRKAIAGCYIKKGQYQQAIEEFKKLLWELSSDNKEFLDVKYELADMYEKNNEYKDALAQYREIQSQDAGYKDVARKVEMINGLLSDGKTQSEIK